MDIWLAATFSFLWTMLLWMWCFFFACTSQHMGSRILLLDQRPKLCLLHWKHRVLEALYPQGSPCSTSFGLNNCWIKFFGHIIECKIAWWCGSSIFSFLRNHQTSFPKWLFLHFTLSTAMCEGSNFLILGNMLLPFCFLFLVAILVCVRWYLIMVLSAFP